MYNRYEESKARLQKIENSGYKIVSICVFEIIKLSSENHSLENVHCSQTYVKNSPIIIRIALYGGRTEATKTYYRIKERERIHYVDVMSLYPYICKYGKFPFCKRIVYVRADCTPDCLDREVIIKCNFLPSRNLYLSVPPYITSPNLRSTCVLIVPTQ